MYLGQNMAEIQHNSSLFNLAFILLFTAVGFRGLSQILSSASYTGSAVFLNHATFTLAVQRYIMVE